MNSVKKYINQAIFMISSLLLIVLVLTVTWQVFSRYVLRSPSIFTDELARFLLMWISMLGVTYAFGTKAHLSMDYLHTLLPKESLKWVNFFIFVISVIFIFLVMVMGGGFLSLNTMQQLTPVLQIPMGVIYLALPITGLLNIFYLYSDMQEDWMKKGGQ